MKLIFLFLCFNLAYTQEKDSLYIVYYNTYKDEAIGISKTINPFDKTIKYSFWAVGNDSIVLRCDMKKSYKTLRKRAIKKLKTVNFIDFTKMESVARSRLAETKFLFILEKKNGLYIKNEIVVTGFYGVPQE